MCRYYLRSRPKADAIQFTVDKSHAQQDKDTTTPKAAEEEPVLVCRRYVSGLS